MAQQLLHAEGQLLGSICLGQPAIPVAGVANTVWKLTTPDSYHSVVHQFSMGKSTVRGEEEHSMGPTSLFVHHSIELLNI